MTSPKIQKDIVHVSALETTDAIIEDLRGNYFSILVYESRDASNKEQMALVLRYVNKRGCITERLLGIMHVKETTTLLLISATNDLLIRYKLSLPQLHGQGYDGTSNMSGEFNGLKSLILKENNAAHFVHCFAHQLELKLVVVAKNHVEISLLFNLISNIATVFGASCKREDMIRERHAVRIAKALDNGERESNVLEAIEEDSSIPKKRAEARVLLNYIQSFDFVFSLHLMKMVLGITNELYVLLQRKDQDIVNAVKPVNICKQRIQAMRDDDEEFQDLKGIGDLARKMVETKRDMVYPLVYQLLKFAQLLPVATATVERTFSAMKCIKNRLRSKMRDEWMNDCLVTYIERDIFEDFSNEVIMRRFQGMKDHCGNLGQL